MSLRRDVHPVLDLHVSAEVSLQVELTGAVRTLEGFAASVEMHVAQQVVHSVERLATHLGESGKQPQKRRSYKRTCTLVELTGVHGGERGTHLALEGLDGQVDNHVRLESLLLDEAFEAHVTLEGPDAVVDEHVPLQVGRQRELARAHVTLVAFDSLQRPNTKTSLHYFGGRGKIETRKTTSAILLQVALLSLILLFNTSDNEDLSSIQFKLQQQNTTLKREELLLIPEAIRC